MTCDKKSKKPRLSGLDFWFIFIIFFFSRLSDLVLRIESCVHGRDLKWIYEYISLTIFRCCEVWRFASFLSAIHKKILRIDFFSFSWMLSLHFSYLVPGSFIKCSIIVPDMGHIQLSRSFKMIKNSKWWSKSVKNDKKKINWMEIPSSAVNTSSKLLSIKCWRNKII